MDFLEPFTLLVLTVSQTFGDWPCLFDKPCTCDYVNKGVDCTNNGLTNIPSFINYLDGSWYMDFSNNNLTNLPRRAFQNISLASLRLSNNQLTSIEDGALEGNEASIRSLYLDGNLLEHIPSEVGKLHHLYEFYVDGNPIKTFNDEMFGNISSQLSTIVFGSKEMTVWPAAVGRLTNAFDMTIKNTAFESMPDEAFSTLGSLYTLTLISNSLRSIPTSLQKTRMFKLELDGNKNLREDGFPPAAFKGQKELRQFYINNGAMETLPPIFAEMSVLAVFDLTNTPLKYLNDDVFPKNFSNIFFEFSSDNSLFETVPPILSKTSSFSTLKLTNNKITYINETDFSGNKELFWLYLSGNPITTISDDAFKHNPTLYYIYLDNTNLTTIPRAIQNVHKLSLLDLTNTKVECTCKNLGWMKYWEKRPKNFKIGGKCYMTEMLLNDYVLHNVPKC